MPDADAIGSRPGRGRLAAAGLAALLATLAATAGTVVPRAFHVVVGFTVKALQDVDVEDGKRSLKVWADRLVRSRVPDARVDLLLFESVSDVIVAVRAKRVDMVGMSAGEYVELRGSVPLEPAMVAEVDGDVYQDVVLAARHDLSSNGVAGLKGSRLLTVRNPGGTAPAMWLETQLMRLGNRTPEEFFSSVKRAQSASQAILAVFFGSADACLVTKDSYRTAVELNPQVGQRLGIVATSSHLAGAVVSFRPDVDRDDRESVVDIMQHAHETPAGRQLFTLFRMGRLVPFRAEYLSGIDSLHKEHDEMTRRMSRNRR